jgi:hypothetical protein
VIASLLSLRWLKVVALLACAWPQHNGATDPPTEKKIRVTLVVVLASERGDKVQVELKCLAEAVRKKYPAMKSFRIGSMKCQDVAEKDRVEFKLPEKQKAEVVVNCACDHQKKVCLAVAAPTLGEIEYLTVCGKFLPIITDYYTQNDERVILAVRVQPCPCPKK